MFVFFYYFFADTTGSGPDQISAAAIFKRGVFYRGVYCPSLTNSFRESHLEISYQRYSHRQRQKSLIIVNFVDILMKTILACKYIFSNIVGVSPKPAKSQKIVITHCFVFNHIVDIPSFNLTYSVISNIEK